MATAGKPAAKKPAVKRAEKGAVKRATVPQQKPRVRPGEHSGGKASGKTTQAGNRNSSPGRGVPAKKTSPKRAKEKVSTKQRGWL